MSGLRRFCLFVFVLAAALCLCALALPWFGPYQNEATALMNNDYYYLAILVALGITALGVLVVLLRALFTPRKRKTVVVSKSGHDQITVTTQAISSQATHVIENSGDMVAEKVRVTAKKGGKVMVDVRVRPRQTVNIAQEGERLHDNLAEGLSVICADKVRRINLEFLEAEEPAPAQDVVVERIDPLEVPASVYEHAAQLEAASSEITVPISATLTSPKPEDASAAEEEESYFAIEGKADDSSERAAGADETSAAATEGEEA